MPSVKLSSHTILAAIITLCLAGTALAAPAGLGGMDVALYQGASLLAETTTNDSGTFLLEGVEAGAYNVVVSDPAGAFNLDFALEVAAEEAPATIAGHVFGCDYADFSLGVVARVVSPSEGEELAVDRVMVKPRHWARGFKESSGRVKVKIWGSGLDMIETVTLKSDKGEVSTADVRVVPSKDLAIATFFKGEAYDSLVPAGVGARDIFSLEVIIGTSEGDLTYPKEIRKVGRNRPNH
jgi:hypothetical protein